MRRVALVILLVVAFGACSSSPDATGPESSAQSTVVPTAELAVTATEFAYDVTTLAVPADQKVTIDFTNAGTIPHEWAVLKKGLHIEKDEQFREDMVLFEVEAVPEGTSATSDFTLASGDYQVVCALEGHFAAGMHGALTALD